MLIRNFQDTDILEASKLAKLTWGDFYTEEPPELQKIIYDFMIEYYDRNRNYSFSIIENGLKGFILAFTKNDKYTKQPDFNGEKIAQDLFNYLELCGKEVENIMEADDIMLGLFVSIQKGCGRQLLQKLFESCKGNIYLWTDTTCDCDYYAKNNFELIKKFDIEVNNKTITTLIYKKSR